MSRGKYRDACDDLAQAERDLFEEVAHHADTAKAATTTWSTRAHLEECARKLRLAQSYREAATYLMNKQLGEALDAEE